MVTGVVDELLAIAKTYKCEFTNDFSDKVIAQMCLPVPNETVGSVMYQDYQARRPMEIETFLASPIRLAKKVGVPAPRLEVLYALLYDKNQKQLKGETPPSPSHQQLPPRSSSFAGPGPGPGMRPAPNGMKNGRMPGGRAPSLTGPPPGMPGMRRPPNGHIPRMQNGATNGYANGVGYSRRGSMDGNELEEFSHVMLYETPAGEGAGSFQDGSSGSYGEATGPVGAGVSSTDLVLRERELAIRQREIELREREQQMSMRRGPPPPRQRQGRRPPPGAMFDDDDDEDDYFDPMGGAPRGPAGAGVDENFDMLSITSRRNRKTSSNSHQPAPSRSRNIFNRNPKNRSSTRLMNEMPSPHESLMNNALLGYSSNRYGTVDRSALEAESRQNSMTSSRVDDLTRGASYGAYPAIRRASQSPGNPLQSPTGTGPRTSPPNGYTNGAPNGGMPNGMSNGAPNGMRNGAPNGRPSPPGMRQPVPRHPPGHGNSVAPQQVEQHAGVSNLYPLKQSPQVRSLTGSASASAKSGDSASANIGSENTTSNSSSSSLQPRPHGDIRV